MRGRRRRLKPRPDKGWTLDEESDDDGDVNVVEESNNGEGEVITLDPLDAFMSSIVLPKVEEEKIDGMEINGDKAKKGGKDSIGRIMQGEDSDSDYGDAEKNVAAPGNEDDDEFLKKVKKARLTSYRLLIILISSIRNLGRIFTLR